MQTETVVIFDGTFVEKTIGCVEKTTAVISQEINLRTSNPVNQSPCVSPGCEIGFTYL